MDRLHIQPWWGCTKISPACDRCYAADLDKRTGGDHWGNVPRLRTGEKNWNELGRWQKAAAAFFAAYGRKRRVFCASIADVFNNQVDTAWRDELWALIRECPDLDRLSDQVSAEYRQDEACVLGRHLARMTGNEPRYRTSANAECLVCPQLVFDFRAQPDRTLYAGAQ